MRLHLRQIAAILLIPGLLSTLTTPARAENPDVIYARAIRGVVYIENEIPGQGVASGSGFLVDRERKLIVTCYHVAADEEFMDVYFPAREGDGNLIVDRDYYRRNREALGRLGFYSVGRVVARDPSKDLAIVKVKRIPEGIRELGLATDDPEKEARLHILGNPGGRDLWRWTLGSVREIARYRHTFREDGQRVDFKALHAFDGSFHGNSGGPVLNDDGEVVGVCESGGGEGGMDSTAVYRTEVKDLLDSVERYRVFSIENKTSTTLHYSTRWGDGPWEKHTLAPGESRVQWHTGSDVPEIRFDASFEDGYQEQSYELETYAADLGRGGAASKEWDAREYRFRSVDGGVDLREVPGSP
jgi:S1-C subfamily serine protease